MPLRLLPLQWLTAGRLGIWSCGTCAWREWSLGLPRFRRRALLPRLTTDKSCPGCHNYTARADATFVDSVCLFFLPKPNHVRHCHACGRRCVTLAALESGPGRAPSPQRTQIRKARQLANIANE